jgi:hypothetical protein
MAREYLAPYFQSSGLSQEAGETKLQFVQRVIVATRGGEQWHPSYKPVVNHLFEMRQRRRTDDNFFHFNGRDDRLQFDSSLLPPNFDTENTVFIVPISGTCLVTLTAQFGDESFFYSVSNGHYAAMLDKAWNTRIRGSEETLIEFMAMKIIKIPKTAAS